MIKNLLLLLQPPSSPIHPPVLYYTVTHNVSGNGSELAFNTTTNEAFLNGPRYEETHSILICAINSVGKGPITVSTFFISKTKITKISITAFCTESNYYETTTVVSSITSIVASPSANKPGEMDTVNDVSFDYSVHIHRYDINTNQLLHRTVFY